MTQARRLPWRVLARHHKTLSAPCLPFKMNCHLFAKWSTTWHNRRLMNHRRLLGPCLHQQCHHHTCSITPCIVNRQSNPSTWPNTNLRRLHQQPHRRNVEFSTAGHTGAVCIQEIGASIKPRVISRLRLSKTGWAVAQRMFEFLLRKKQFRPTDGVG